MLCVQDGTGGLNQRPRRARVRSRGPSPETSQPPACTHTNTHARTHAHESPPKFPIWFSSCRHAHKWFSMHLPTLSLSLSLSLPLSYSPHPLVLVAIDGARRVDQPAAPPYIPARVHKNILPRPSRKLGSAVDRNSSADSDNSNHHFCICRVALQCMRACVGSIATHPPFPRSRTPGPLRRRSIDLLTSIIN